jgi:hypothetical protein
MSSCTSLSIFLLISRVSGDVLEVGHLDLSLGGSVKPTGLLSCNFRRDGEHEQTASLVIQAMVYHSSEMYTANASERSRQQDHSQAVHRNDFVTMTDFVVCIRCAVIPHMFPLGECFGLSLFVRSRGFSNFLSSSPHPISLK